MTPAPASRRRRVIRWGLLLVAAAVIVAAAGVVFAPVVVRLAIARIASDAGLSLERVEVRRVDFRTVELTQLELGPFPRIRADTIRVHYDVPLLLGRRVERIEIEGLDVAIEPRLAAGAAAARRGDAAPPLAERVEAVVRAFGASLRALGPLPLDEIALTSAKLQIETALGAWNLSGDGALRSPPGATPHLESRVQVRHPGGALAGPLRIAVEDEALHAELMLRDAEGAQALSARARLAVDEDAATGSLDLAFGGFDVPGIGAGLGGTARLRLVPLGSGHYAVAVEEPLRVQWQSIDEALRLWIPDIVLREVLSEPVIGVLTPAPGSESLAELRLPAGAPLAGRVDLSLRLEAGRGATARLDVSANVELARNDASPQRIDDGELSLQLRRWPTETTPAAELDAYLALAGTLASDTQPLRLEGNTSLRGRAVKIESEAVRAESLELALAGAVAVGAASLEIDLERCGAVTLVDALLIGDVELPALALEVCAGGPPAPAIILSFAGEGEPAGGLSLDIATPETEIAGTFLREDEEPLAFEGRSPALRLRGRASSALHSSGELESRGGDVVEPESRLRLSDLVGSIAWRAGPEPLRVAARTELSVAHPAATPKLKAILELVHVGGHADLKARLRDDEARFVFDLAGSHEAATGVGSASWELEDLLFDVGAFQPGELVSALDGRVWDAVGAISAAGEASWSREELVSRLDVGFDFPRLVADGFPVIGLAGSVHFDSLAPLEAPPARVVIQHLFGGIDVTDVALDFQVVDDELSLDALSGRAAGGTIDGEGSVALARPADGALTLRVRELQLSSLLSQLDIQGLAGEGVLEGDIFLQYDDDGLYVDGGELRAREPGGWIRYVPSTPPEALGAGGATDGGLGTLLAALANFRFDTMRVASEGELDGDVLIEIQLAGANPDLYGGVPFELNVPVTVPLGSLLRTKAAIYLDQGALEGLLDRSP